MKRDVTFKIYIGNYYCFEKKSEKKKQQVGVKKSYPHLLFLPSRSQRRVS